MGALAARFGAPPFSVLDTRQGYWTLRKSEWKQLTGDLTETKENVLAGPGSMLASVNGGSSNFDPVLAELMYRWFCPPRGKILDPFGGEQTKGVVAGALGYTYRGVEFRPEQVAVNERACARFPSVAYRCGDSEGIEALVEERDFDLLLTSPPYYDLEVYSAADMSAMPSYADFLAKYQRIFEACARMLRPDGAFVVVKVGEIRDKDSGEYRDFVGDTVATLKAAGLHYYNEAVLINNPGTAPLRAAQSFRSRKLVKLHQNVLVFWSGDLSAITARFEGLDNEGVALPGEADPL
jgi:SAM-dependent methyltransferase